MGADSLLWPAICSAARSAARGRKHRARGNGGQGRRSELCHERAPCVARAHALPTCGAARRTIGYVARPPAALGIPLCVEWPRSSRGEIGLRYARACPAPSPRWGPILMRVCRPLPPVGQTTGARAGGKDATSAAPCVRRGLREPPRAIRERRAIAMRSDQQAAPAFSCQFAVFSRLCRGDYRASPSNTALHRSWMLAERACVLASNFVLAMCILES